MEKTYYVSTLIFGFIISLSLAIFAIFAFKLSYPIIGGAFILICIASVVVNILFLRGFYAKQKD